ncbi:MAG: hypothetical protein Q9172_004556 [Xanthocarpia lactea]
MDPRLNAIPFNDLEKAFQASDERLDEQQEYNTHAHTLEDISNALPQVNHVIPSATQPFLPLEPWCDVIMSTQGLSDHNIHRIELPQFFISQVLSASQIALMTGYISDCIAEDIAELFSRRTTRGMGSRSCSEKEGALLVWTRAV